MEKATINEFDFNFLRDFFIFSLIDMSFSLIPILVTILNLFFEKSPILASEFP